jgi:23S rRNA pseudouridine2605 synthase
MPDDDLAGFSERLMRLQKFLAECGVCSRRTAEGMIVAGRVKVNDEVVTRLGYTIDPANDYVLVDGDPVEPQEKVYYVLNKPRGCLTTRSDPHGRPTVFDILGDIPFRVFAVGRLDFETEGLLFFTNDGRLKYRLTHPKFGVARTYRAIVEGRPAADAIRRLAEGVDLEDGRTAPAKVRPVKMGENSSEIELTLYEGKKNEVRRMCAAVGHAVMELRRISMAGLKLGALPKGESRSLTESEIATLEAAASLKPE